MTRSLKLILLFFELNFMSYCLTFQTMRLYLQMVLRMVTQLDQPTPSDTYKCRLPDNASIFSAEIKAVDLALDHIEQSRNSDFIIFSDSLSVLQSLHNRHIKTPFFWMFF